MTHRAYRQSPGHTAAQHTHAWPRCWDLAGRPRSCGPNVSDSGDASRQAGGWGCGDGGGGDGGDDVNVLEDRSCLRQRQPNFKRQREQWIYNPMQIKTHGFYFITLFLHSEQGKESMEGEGRKKHHNLAKRRSSCCCCWSTST